MSINYVMYLADNRRANEVRDEVTRTVQHPHVSVVVTEVGAPIDRYVKEDHGFMPHARVHLHLDKENLEPAQNEVLDIVGLLLRRNGSDAVLLREEESVALKRRSGKISITEDALFRDPSRREWVDRLSKRRGSTIA